MLQDRAFESGLVFNAELITDQEPLLRELADDYWRAHFHAIDPVVAALALAEGVQPAGLARLLGQVVSHPLLRILPEENLRSMRPCCRRSRQCIFAELSRSNGRSGAKKSRLIYFRKKELGEIGESPRRIGDAPFAAG